MEDIQIRAYPRQLLIRGFHTGVAGLYYLILASNLTPQEFGTVALVAVILTFAGLVSEAGLEQALVQSSELTPFQLSSTLWFVLGTSGILFIFLFAFAPSLGALFSDESLGPLLRQSLFAIPASAAAAVPRAIMLRAHRFAQVSGYDLMSVLIAAVPGCWAILADQGIWSFAIFTLTYAFVRLIGTFALSGWSPRLVLHSRSLGPLIRTGWNLQVFGILNSLGKQTDVLIVGKFLGSGPLGLYNVAYRVISFVQDVLLGPFRQMALPMYSQAQGDVQKTYRMMCRDTKVLALCIMPLLGIMSSSAHWVIPTLFGSEWEPAVVLVGVFCLEAGRQALTGLVPTTMTALGRSGLLRRYAMVSLPVLVFSYVAGLPWGIFGVVSSFFLANTALNLFLIILFQRSVRSSLSPLALQWVPGLCVSVFALVATTIFQDLFGGGITGGLLAMSSSATATLFITRSFFPESWRLCKTMAQGLLGARRNTTARRPIVFVDPLENDGNPHLSLLHHGVIETKGVDLRQLHFTSFALTLPLRRLTEFWDARVALHLHFVNRHYESKYRSVAIVRFIKLLAAVVWCRVFFVRIVWTFHDEVAHDFRFRSLERFFLFWLVQLCDVILTLSERGREILWTRYGRTENVEFTPHPPYDGVFPRAMSRSKARTQLHVSPATTLYVFCGRVMPYKGLEELICVFSKWNPGKRVQLIIAGKPITEEYADLLATQSGADERIDLRFELLSDEALANLVSAADFGILPYREILHSGTAMLFSTFGCPIIVPSKGWFPEIFQKHRIGIMYQPQSDDGLDKALDRSLKSDPTQFRTAMRSLNGEWSLEKAVHLTVKAYGDL